MPRRRPAEDRSEWAMSTLLPPNNRPAGRSYVLALFGLIPGLGALLGPTAVAFGWFGLRQHRRDPKAMGKGHAMVGMTLGVLEILVNALGWSLIALGLGWA